MNVAPSNQEMRNRIQELEAEHDALEFARQAAYEQVANLTRTREALEVEHLETLNKLKEAELEITSLHRMFTTSALRGLEEK